MSAHRSDHPDTTSLIGKAPGHTDKNRLIYSILLTMVPWLYLFGIRVASEYSIIWTELVVQGLFICFVLVISQLLSYDRIKLNKYTRTITWLMVIIGVVSAVVYIINQETIAAWLLIIFIYSLLLRIDAWISLNQDRIRSSILHVLLCFIAGGSAVAIAQIESHFSDEEFLAFQQVVILAVLWLILLVPDRSWSKTLGIDDDTKSIPGRLIHLGLTVAVISGLILTLRAYQMSFYPAAAPTYNGISAEQPFICSHLPPEAQTYDGINVFQNLLALVKSNPNKESPEYGQLAIATGEHTWAESFRQTLLEEARQGLYAQPAKSIKYGQCLAAQRVYYYAKVIKVFPRLFTADEIQEISRWFQEINRRTLTVEPVDWLYALAFNQWPAGPYENQECGAGLLAALEAFHLSDPALSGENQKYLAKSSRGWSARFRNTDDAYIYQVQWLQNAFFQYLFNNQANHKNERLSLEWLLIQSLPDGTPLSYNHIGAAAPEQTAYWGASWLQDPVFLWLAGRSAETLSSKGKTLFAKPGMETPMTSTGVSPTWGSCLIYGDSGLPNQQGPLAPDKIVFREGWAPDSSYLLLNLRFTGWHRYKATNSVDIIYQSAPLIGMNNDGYSPAWLPAGRSLLRDKRILREDLNGLLIERTGMASVLQKLSGTVSPWAQDPPYFALVKNFETSETLDTSTTVIEDWRGWKHTRTISFFHPGPIIILDTAQSQNNKGAGLVWHLKGDEIVRFENRFQLYNRGDLAEMVVIPLESGYQVSDQVEGEKGREVLVRPQQGGYLAIATIFLLNDWAKASISLDDTPQGKALIIEKDGRRLVVSVE